MESKSVLMSHGNYCFCSSNGQFLKKINTAQNITYADLLKGNQFKIFTLMIKKEVYEKAGLYPKDLGFYGDEERYLSFRILEAKYKVPFQINNI